jgi:vancomycin resistance protein YoaR
MAAGDLLTRADTAERARGGEIDVPLLPVVDPQAAFVLFSDLKEAEDLAPVAARMDLDHREIVSEKDGRYVDIDGAVASIYKAALDRESRTVMVPRAAIKPLVTRASLSKIDIHEVVASFETKFGRSGGAANRARNIEVAAARLNGLVIPGGGTISFNTVVGARSEENGFKHAPEIFKGEMIDGVGGGTCQVASTFHAAAMYAGLDVLERLPHSRPSGYIPMGFDATVVYPSVDLKIRNPFPFPLVVHAWVEDTKLKMELLGERKQVEVTIGNTVVGSAPYARKIVEEAGLEKPVTKQRGIRGYHIRRSRTIAFSNGEKRVETSMDVYPPTTEIYRVPAGYDPTELPPLPEDEKKQDG